MLISLSFHVAIATALFTLNLVIVITHHLAYVLLPPDFRLHAVSYSACLVAVRVTADKASESIRPVCVSDEGPQNRPAEKVAPRSDLRRDGEFPQPAAIET